MQYDFASFLPIMVVIFFIMIFISAYIGLKNTYGMSKMKVELDKFYEVIKNSPMSIVIMDNRGKIKYVNPKYLDGKGYDYEEIIGRDYLELECDPKLRKLWSDIRRGKSWQGQLYTKDKYGVHYWIEINIFNIKNRKGKIVNLISIANDITTKKMVQKNLKTFSNIYVNMVENIPCAIYRFKKDENDLYTYDYISPTCEKIFGISAKDIIEDPINLVDLIYPPDFLSYNKEFLNSQNNKKPFVWTGRVIYKGIIKWVKFEAIPHDYSNDCIIWDGLAIDITEQRNVQEEIIELNDELRLISEKFERMSYTDSLTGAHNRRKILEIGRSELLGCKLKQESFFAVMMDIDKFKLINDTYGHEIGDKILINVTSICKKMINNNMAFGRIGGEEFLFTITTNSLEDLVIIMNRFRIAISKSYVMYYKKCIHVTVSMGIATMINANDGLDKIISRADKALYKAKNTGRNKICISD